MTVLKGYSTLTKAEVEQKIQAGKCRHEIRTIGDSSSQKYITKYVADLDMEPLITEVRIYANQNGKFNIPAEYHSDVTYGANVKALFIFLYSEGVMSNDRIAAFLNAAGGDALGLSEGSVYGFCRKLGEAAQTSIRQLEDSLRNQGIVATDATTVTVNGKQNDIRNFSIENTVVYHAMESKSVKVLKGLDFLKQYAGVLLHDHETALYHFGTDHAECNVHIIRYLRKNIKETGNRWSGEMMALLCEINETRKQLKEQGIPVMPDEIIREYEEKYFFLLYKGHDENRTTSHRYAKKEELTLLNRMEKYSHNHLLFLHDFEVPFDDNISERDLGKAKNRQKMAGGFRKKSGHEMYCSIMTIIEPLREEKWESLKI